MTETTSFHKTRDANSPLVFQARQRQHVRGLTGVVITVKLGRVLVKKATNLGKGRNSVHVESGDILYLLRYEGEGFYKIWFRGGIYSDEIPVGQSEGGSNEYFRVLSGPQTVWWVKVRNRRGQIGWSKEVRHFAGMDACG